MNIDKTSQARLVKRLSLVPLALIGVLGGAGLAMARHDAARSRVLGALGLTPPALLASAPSKPDTCSGKPEKQPARARQLAPQTPAMREAGLPAQLASLETTPAKPTTKPSAKVRPYDIAKVERRARQQWVRAHPELAKRPAKPGTYEEVAHLVSRYNWDGLNSTHRQMIRRMMLQARRGEVLAAPCFAPGTDPRVMQAFESTAAGLQLFRLLIQYWQNPSSGPHPRGATMVLRWSIVPDGTVLPTGIGEPSANSNLRARLNTLYGSESVWLPLFRAVFARYEQLSGIRYIEVTDDGVPVSGSNPGSAAAGSTRGDVRIGGHPLDGNSNTLAYNFSPDYGDMVIDTADNSYENMTNSSRLLRNTLSHEHGHGLGFAHVCPINQTKLMEPFLSLSFEGPQTDDIQNAQRGYGDTLEENDTQAAPTDLGALANGLTTRGTLSLDGSNDLDFYRISTSSPRRLTVAVRPQGGAYLEGPQNSDSSCTAGTTFNAMAQRNLAVAVLNASGTVIAQSDTTGAGSDETITNAILSAGAGPFAIRVSGDGTDAAQLYNLEVTLATGANAPDFELSGTPTVSDNTGNGNNNGLPDPGESQLRLSIPLQNIGASNATNVTGTLVSLTTGVTVTSASAAYPNIAVGATATNTTRPVFRVSDSFACGTPINLQLNVSSTEGSDTIPFTLATGSLARTTFAYTGAAQAIPDDSPSNGTPGTVVTATINVSGLNAITDLNFAIDGTNAANSQGITHPRIGDLGATLTSPAGTTIVLFNQINDGSFLINGPNFVGTILDDEAATSIQNVTNAQAPYTGSFRPQGSLAAFDGQSPNGIWTLRVSDAYGPAGQAGGAAGTLRAFSLRIESQTCQAALFPSAVRLIDLGADSLSDGTWIHWRTGLETDNLGFHVYRQVRSGGQWQKATRLTPSLIAGSALQNGRNADPRGGFSYGWRDTQATPSALARYGSANVRYWLQDADTHGLLTTHGPASPVPGSGTLSGRRNSKLVSEMNAQP